MEVLDGTPLSIMSRTLKIQVRGKAAEFRRRHLLDFINQDREADLIAAWQKDRSDTWYATFESTRIVDELDGHEMKYKDVDISLQFSAADRIVVKGRVHWLPIWENNTELRRHLEQYGEVRQVAHQTEQGVATGVREITMTMREGDQDSIPYIGRLNGHKYLMVIPGRPPVCFRCERAGHLRQHCPAYMHLHEINRSYASIVRQQAVSKPNPAVSKPAPAVRKPGETGEKESQGAVSKPIENEKAVSKPDEAVGMPDGAVSKPQEERGEDVGNPQVMSGAEDVGNPQEMTEEETLNLTPNRDSLALELIGDSQPVETSWADEMDEEDQFEEVKGKRRKVAPVFSQPESPNAAQPSRANR